MMTVYLVLMAALCISVIHSLMVMEKGRTTETGQELRITTLLTLSRLKECTVGVFGRHLRWTYLRNKPLLRPGRERDRTIRVTKPIFDCVLNVAVGVTEPTLSDLIENVNGWYVPPNRWRRHYFLIGAGKGANIRAILGAINAIKVMHVVVVDAEGHVHMTRTIPNGLNPLVIVNVTHFQDPFSDWTQNLSGIRVCANSLYCRFMETFFKATCEIVCSQTPLSFHGDFTKEDMEYNTIGDDTLLLMVTKRPHAEFDPGSALLNVFHWTAWLCFGVGFIVFVFLMSITPSISFQSAILCLSAIFLNQGVSEPKFNRIMFFILLLLAYIFNTGFNARVQNMATPTPPKLPQTYREAVDMRYNISVLYGFVTMMDPTARLFENFQTMYVTNLFHSGCSYLKTEGNVIITTEKDYVFGDLESYCFPLFRNMTSLEFISADDLPRLSFMNPTDKDEPLRKHISKFLLYENSIGIWTYHKKETERSVFFYPRLQKEYNTPQDPPDPPREVIYFRHTNVIFAILFAGMSLGFVSLCVELLWVSPPFPSLDTVRFTLITWLRASSAAIRRVF